jgi:endonuclease/exonuclease/phosphatase family metal-dependent hydrolase
VGAKTLKSALKGTPIGRFFGPALTGSGIVATLVMVLTGQIDLSQLDLLRQNGDGSSASAQATIQPVNLQSLGQKSPETVRIATFNIQVFGKKKASDSEVMPILAQIVSQFDVVAIQEVRGGDAEPIQALVDLLRASGAYYSATISEPIGRTSQTESYAFVWDATRIRFVEGSAYLVQDQADRMHREPMVASFESRVGLADGRRPFRFTLINAHTSPSEVEASAIANEMNVLDDVFVRVRQYDYQTTGEEDCIMLGDLNVDTKGLRELGQIPNVVTIAGDLMTNTRRTKTYDHILLDRTLTREYTGRFGILDFERDLGLSEEMALRVSDHMPLWAEFSAYEVPRFEPVANQPQPAPY